jgi:hypothetical protein
MKILFTYYFCFVKFVSCECLTTTPISWGYKTVVYYCRLLKEYMRKNHHFSQKFDINSQVTLVRKCSLATSLRTWSLNDWKIQRVELMPSSWSPFMCTSYKEKCWNGFWHILFNFFSQNGVYVWTSMAFRTNDDDHGHIHGIVDDILTIFTRDICMLQCKQ